MQIDNWRLAALADAARDAAERSTESRYVQLYASGVEDILRYLTGERPTADLRDIIPANLLEG
jgi:hypothetical protein